MRRGCTDVVHAVSGQSPLLGVAIEVQPLRHKAPQTSSSSKRLNPETQKSMAPVPHSSLVTSPWRTPPLPPPSCGALKAHFGGGNERRCFDVHGGGKGVQSGFYQRGTILTDSLTH